MNTKSQFRKLYFAKFITGHILVIAFTVLLFFITRDFVLSLFFGILASIFLVSCSLKFYSMSKITITKDGIINEPIFFNRKTFISFTEIKSIIQEKLQLETRRGAVSDGFYETTIELKNGHVLIISADCYENYNELKSALQNAVNPESAPANLRKAKAIFFNQPEAFISKK